MGRQIGSAAAAAAPHMEAGPAANSGAVLSADSRGHIGQHQHQHDPDDVLLLVIKDVDTYCPDGSNTICDFLKFMQQHVASVGAQ
eukprot:gene9459-9624_t